MSNGNWWNAAVVVGARSDEVTNVTVNGILNLGVGFLSSGDVEADGNGTVTVNSLGPDNNLTNTGLFSNVSSFLSGGTTMKNTGSYSWAWDIVGASNTLETTGPFSVAGAFSQENETVLQEGPGINVKYRTTVGSSARTKAKPGGTKAKQAGGAAGGGSAAENPATATADTGKQGAGHVAKARNRS
jgi:hypothetical protein